MHQQGNNKLRCRVLATHLSIWTKLEQVGENSTLFAKMKVFQLIMVYPYEVIAGNPNNQPSHTSPETSTREYLP